MAPSSARNLLRTLSSEEAHIEERLRTLALCVCASGVVGYGLYSLRGTLVPLVLAIALTYLLQPLIEVLSTRPLHLCCGVVLCRRPPESLRTVRPRLRPFAECALQAKLPRWLAVCVALLIAFAILGLLGFIVADSIHVFTQRAAIYSERVTQLCMGAVRAMDGMRNRLVAQIGPLDASPVHAAGANATVDEEVARQEMDRLARLAGKLPVTELIMVSLSSMMEALSNLALVLLFAVYLLLGSPGPSKHARAADSVNAQATAQINLYIRGKVAMSLLVGTATAIALCALHVDLWLVFGLLAFWLNFIPNVGTVLAVALPMPLVVLDPAFSNAGVILALALPLSAHAFAGNVLEPLLFGHTLKLHPVTVLLSLLLWGTVWGITGMVLAVPITAVLRIRLSHIAHPLPQFIASILVGETADESLEDELGGDGLVGRAMRATVNPMTPMAGVRRPDSEEGRARLLSAQSVRTPTLEPVQDEEAMTAIPPLPQPPKSPALPDDAPQHHHAL